MAATALKLSTADRADPKPAVWWATVIAPLAAAGVAFAWILRSQVLRLDGLAAPSWDLGQTQQLLWSLANGYGWTSSFEYGHNFVGIHLEPILLALAAVERIWPSPVVPLVFSAAGLAAAAPAGWLMFRALLGERPGARWLALALGITVPFWAATQQTAAEQFHPENMALAFAMFAVWAAFRGNAWLLWVFTLLVLSCKEDQVYTAFLIGLVTLRLGPEPMRVHGRRIIILAALWLFFGVFFLEEMVRGAGYSPDIAYYGWVFNPADKKFILINIARPEPWVVLAGLLASVVGLPLLAWRWSLFVIPPLLANLMSSHEAQGEMHLHYVLIVMFPMILAAGIGGRRLLDSRRVMHVAPRALLAAAIPGLALGVLWGQVPPALGSLSWLYSQPQAGDRLLTAASVIPANARVYADDGAAVWLANRQYIQVLPTDLPADGYIVIDRQDWNHHNEAQLARADEIAMLEASGRRLLVDDGRFQVWAPPGA